jgi:hypothetical protein
MEITFKRAADDRVLLPHPLHSHGAVVGYAVDNATCNK